MKNTFKNIAAAVIAAIVFAPWVVIVMDLFFWMLFGIPVASDTLGIGYTQARILSMVFWPIGFGILVGWFVSTL